MKIIMKDYDLESFKEKDIYTFDEIIEAIKQLEEENKDMIEQIDKLEQKLQNMSYDDDNYEDRILR